MLILNQNTVDEMGKTRAWLENAKNQELKQWGEALAVLCQTYASFKIGLAYWLPVVNPEVLAQLITVKDSYDVWHAVVPQYDQAGGAKPGHNLPRRYGRRLCSRQGDFSRSPSGHS